MAKRLPLRVLQEPEVERTTGLKHTRIWELERAGQFPRRIKIGERAVGWLAHEIEDYIRGRIAFSRAGDRKEAP
jgi:prophage regulatory protein